MKVTRDGYSLNCEYSRQKSITAVGTPNKENNYITMYQTNQ